MKIRLTKSDKGKTENLSFKLLHPDLCAFISRLLLGSVTQVSDLRGRLSPLVLQISLLRKFSI